MPRAWRRSGPVCGNPAAAPDTKHTASVAHTRVKSLRFALKTPNYLHLKFLSIYHTIKILLICCEEYSTNMEYNESIIIVQSHTRRPRHRGTLLTAIRYTHQLTSLTSELGRVSTHSPFRIGMWYLGQKIRFPEF